MSLKVAFFTISQNIALWKEMAIFVDVKLELWIIILPECDKCMSGKTNLKKILLPFATFPIKMSLISSIVNGQNRQKIKRAAAR